MNTDAVLKNLVREKYSEIALQSRETNAQSCCGVGTPGVYNIMSDSYDDLEGYHADADLGLGCGLPTEFAQIQPGDTVIDLGSGAGNDCFIARKEAGTSGKVIGIDFTPAMIDLARKNADRLGYNNVEFRQGDIEVMPIGDSTADVMVSNCVLNLVPNKTNVFREMMRVLRPGGHFSISDVVLIGDLPDSLRNAAEMYAGCVSGAIQREEYLGIIEAAGFENITVQKQKPILIPDHILLEYLSPEALNDFIASKTGIFSITVFANKPGEKAYKGDQKKQEATEPCCAPGSGCC